MANYYSSSLQAGWLDRSKGHFQVGRSINNWADSWDYGIYRPPQTQVFKQACVAIHLGNTSDFWSDPLSTSILYLCDKYHNLMNWLNLFFFSFKCWCHSQNLNQEQTRLSVRQPVVYTTYTNKWATTRQNQQNECVPSKDSDQPGHAPSLISLRCPHEESLGP